MRAIIPDFIPEVRIRLLAACRNKKKDSDFRRTADGYSHEYSHCPEVTVDSVTDLSDIPCDDGFASADREGRDDALTLWEFLGYRPTAVPKNNPIQPNRSHSILTHCEISALQDKTSSIECSASYTGMPLNQPRHCRQLRHILKTPRRFLMQK